MKPKRRFAWYPIRTVNRGWIWLRWVYRVPGPWFGRELRSEDDAGQNQPTR